jgi:hypothetical protein
MDGENKLHIQNFDGGTFAKQPLEDLNTEGRIILKL